MIFGPGWTCNCAQCNGTLEPPEAPECPETCASMLRDGDDCDCPTPEEIKADRAEAVKALEQIAEDECTCAAESDDNGKHCGCYAHDALSAIKTAQEVKP